MIRNPVDMVISWHLQEIKSGHEDVADFKIAWDLQDKRATGDAICKKCQDPDVLQYRKLCSLGDQLERFCKDVPAKQRMIILYDDFKQDPSKVYQDVLEFLGLPSDGRSQFPVINPTSGHMSPLLEKRLNFTIHEFLYWDPYYIS